MRSLDQAVRSGFDSMWSEIDPIGRHRFSGGYRRFAWTSADHSMREWFAAECARRGLTFHEDSAGNQWGWWGDPAAGNALVIGSHLDSVPNGGAFDGPLGVVSALATVDQLRSEGHRSSRPLAVVNFADEEGARFGIACAGSRILTGQLDRDRALGLRDADGITLAEAWRHAGRDPESLAADPRLVDKIGAFIELHVEQGLALADAERDPATSAVAIGSSIWPHGRWRLTFHGQANHAGTTRLEDRKDAMIPCAEMVLAARQLAARFGCVTTVGKIAVEPNGVNAIPSQVTAWMDVRGEDPDQVEGLVDAISRQAEEFHADFSQESWTASTRFDQLLADEVKQILPESPTLSTGAGHDAGILANQGVSTAMLFVRNPTGISHSPEEFAEPDDCHLGVAHLTEVVRELSREAAR